MKKTAWLEKWLNERKCNVRHLRAMISKTRHDRGDDSLIEAREGITKILARKYDVNSPESVFYWLEDLEKHLVKTKNLLEKAKKGLAENSRTAKAYKCTKNLLGKISGKLRNFRLKPENTN
jgi:tricorn protease-like protein